MFNIGDLYNKISFVCDAVCCSVFFDYLLVSSYYLTIMSMEFAVSEYREFHAFEGG